MYKLCVCIWLRLRVHLVVDVTADGSLNYETDGVQITCMKKARICGLGMGMRSQEWGGGVEEAGTFENRKNPSALAESLSALISYNILFIIRFPLDVFSLIISYLVELSVGFLQVLRFPPPDN